MQQLSCVKLSRSRNQISFRVVAAVVTAGDATTYRLQLFACAKLLAMGAALFVHYDSSLILTLDMELLLRAETKIAPNGWEYIFTPRPFGNSGRQHCCMSSSSSLLCSVHLGDGEIDDHQGPFLWTWSDEFTSLGCSSTSQVGLLLLDNHRRHTGRFRN